MMHQKGVFGRRKMAAVERTKESKCRSWEGFFSARLSLAEGNSMTHRQTLVGQKQHEQDPQQYNRTAQ
ncbi:hypothetical protein V2G26_008921 [Clonostachys chloroleuca]